MAPRGETTGYAPMAKLTFGFFSFLLVVSTTNGLPLPPEMYYQAGNIRCLRCPAGTYVGMPCTTQDTVGKCFPCHTGSSFSEGFTGLDHCLTCLSCRDDQEEVRPCTATQNAECRCKKGTYCPLDHPCEVCLTCTESCPPGHELQFPCNSTSDSHCGPAQSGSWIIGVCVPILLILLLLIGLCLCKHLKWCKDGRSRVQMSISLWTGNPDKVEIPLISPCLVFSAETKKEDQEAIFRRSWDHFVDQVPTPKWDQFMRTLCLSPISVSEAKENNRDNSREQKIAMLQAWHQQKSGDVNKLLSYLHSIQLHTPARTIVQKLLQEGHYVDKN
uniref:Death receptor-M2 n=2 Tax=Xenopus laevis TaxID=8355 RepID=Q76B98_XENLA|nr:tumor necrosis factor receptor superfamily member 10b S homeolog precursor [Xenopus laevis]BAD11771.1 death receptor-M2 [Xenopus laevis]